MNKIRCYSDVANLLINTGEHIGDTIEIINANLELPIDKLLTDKARLMSPYYLVGELLFGLREENTLEYIRYYSKFWDKISDDGKTIRSAYGYLIKHGHGFDQLEMCHEKLLANKNNRQAIIHLHIPHNEETKDEICTLSIQFLIRHNKLDMIVTMRSNDIILGLPYDHAFFLMHQYKLAKMLQIDVGRYFHNAGSLHYYDKDNLQVYYGHSATYSFKFDDAFFEDKESLLKIEEQIRVNALNGMHVLDTEELLELLKNVKSPLSKAFIVALVLFSFRTNREMKHNALRIIMEDIPNLDKGLMELIVDYEKLKNDFKGGFICLLK